MEEHVVEPRDLRRHVVVDRVVPNPREDQPQVAIRKGNGHTKGSNAHVNPRGPKEEDADDELDEGVSARLVRVPDPRLRKVPSHTPPHSQVEAVWLKAVVELRLAAILEAHRLLGVGGLDEVLREHVERLVVQVVAVHQRRAV